MTQTLADLHYLERQMYELAEKGARQQALLYSSSSKELIETADILDIIIMLPNPATNKNYYWFDYVSKLDFQSIVRVRGPKLKF